MSQSFHKAVEEMSQPAVPAGRQVTSQDLECRVVDLLAERDDLKRRLAESGAGAAVMRSALLRFHKHSDALGQYNCSAEGNCVAAKALSESAGRDFLAAARQCRDKLHSARNTARSQSDHEDFLSALNVLLSEALAEIEPFLGDKT